MSRTWRRRSPRSPHPTRRGASTSAPGRERLSARSFAPSRSWPGERTSCDLARFPRGTSRRRSSPTSGGFETRWAGARPTSSAKDWSELSSGGGQLPSPLTREVDSRHGSWAHLEGRGRTGGAEDPALLDCRIRGALEALAQGRLEPEVRVHLH